MAQKKIMSRSLQIAHFKTFFFVLSKNSSIFFKCLEKLSRCKYV